MKRIRVFLITVFLFLINSSLIYAGSPKLSGTWDIHTNVITIDVHEINTTVSSSGELKVTDLGDKQTTIPPMFNLEVVQTDDNSIYGVKKNEYISDTISGKITGNSVSFDLIDIYSLTIGSEIDKQTITGNFSGTISGTSISGTFKGIYSSETQTDHYDGSKDYNNITGSFSGSFTVKVTPGKPNIPLPPKPAKQPEPPKDAQLGDPRDRNQKVGDPINSSTGNMHIITTDLTIPGKGMNLEFTRTYNSQEASISSLGYGWTHSYNLYLKEEPLSKQVKIKDEQARGILFNQNPDKTYISQRGEYSSLTKDSSGFIWRKKDGRQYFFDLAGKLKSIKDRNDNTISFTYDSQNRLSSIIDTANRQLNLSYDASNRLISLADSLGRVISYGYDSQNNLIQVTDPQTNSTFYEYGSNHNLIKKKDPLGKRVTFTYDQLGRCTSSSGEDNLNRVELSFDPANQKTVITDSRAGQTIQYYNNDLLITKIIDPAKGQTLSEWDANLNLTSRTDALGNKTSMEYDSKGNLIKIIDPQGNPTNFTYEPNFNLLASSTDALGGLTSYNYDAKGNLLKVSDALGNATSFTYNANGQVLSAVNALGKAKNYSYDSQGNLKTAQDTLGNLTTFTYDGVGNLIQKLDPQGNLSKFDYDQLNQLTRITYPDSTSLSYTYDTVGNRIAVTDANSNTSSFIYDQGHKLKSVTDALGGVTQYDYDTEDNLIKVTDAKGNITTYGYDGLNRLISEANHLGYKKQYQYDLVGNRISLTTAQNQTIKYLYDNLNRLIKITYPGYEIKYSYDLLGRRTAMVDSRGTTSYVYDLLGRLLKIDGPAEKDTVEYGYDALGNRISMTDPDGKTVKYSYDEENRLINITDFDGRIVAFTYDGLNNLSAISYPNGIKTSYSYDSLNRLLWLADQNQLLPASEKIAQFSYTYDKAGRKTAVTTAQGVIEYSYDAKNQLIKETGAFAKNPYSISYDYDPAGNRLSMKINGVEHKYSYNELNQLVREDIISPEAKLKTITVTGKVSDASGIKAVTVNGINAVVQGDTFSCPNVSLTKGANTITVIAIDNAGNSATKQVNVTYQPQADQKIIYSYDNNGNLISKEGMAKTISLSYDAQNRLIHYAAEGLDETYQYDGEGKRIGVNSNSSAAKYLYDGLNLILERGSQGKTLNSYLRNPNAAGGIGGIIKRSGAGTAPEIYYHYDGLGNVVKLSNAAGASAQNYSYDAFGNILSQDGSANNQNNFLSKQTDASGLIYFGARYYDSRIGRWITQDPSGMSDGPNLYLYCQNNPVSYVDLWGLCLDKPWGEKLQLYLTEVGAEMEKGFMTNMQGLIGTIGVGAGAYSNIGIIPKAIGYSNKDFLQGGRMAYQWANQYGKGVKFYSLGQAGAIGSLLSVISAGMTGWTIGETINAYYWGYQNYRNKSGN